MSSNSLTLVLTIVGEFAIFWLITKKVSWRAFFFLLLVNITTQPVALWLYRGPLHNFWAVETLVVLVESVLIWQLFQMKYQQAFAYSVLINIGSALLGALIF